MNLSEKASILKLRTTLVDSYKAKVLKSHVETLVLVFYLYDKSTDPLSVAFQLQLEIFEHNFLLDPYSNTNIFQTLEKLI